MDFYTNVAIINDTVLYRGFSGGGRVERREDFSPTLYVSSKNQTKYKTLDGDCVEPIQLGSIKDAKEFVNTYEAVDNFTIYGNTKYLYQYILSKYPKEVDYDFSQLNIMSLDIETTSENGFPSVEEAREEILCITVKDFTSKKIITWGCGEFKNSRDDVHYVYCENERELLFKFLEYWVQKTPDIITGWNVKFFDMPFICRRIDRMLSIKHMRSMSPWNSVRERKLFMKGQEKIYYDIIGVATLDYYDLYQKFTYTNQESYRLDHIAFVELGQKKLDHSEFENFQDFYRSDWQKFIEYNIHDVELVDMLEDKMKLIELAVTMAYDAKVNFEDVFYQVRMWDNIIYDALTQDNIIIPPKTESTKDQQYAGAYVKEPVPGIYDWVVNFDLNSLYPHLIMQYNISPETLLDDRVSGINVDKLLNGEIDTSTLDGVTLCPNGTLFTTKKQGFLPKLMEKIYTERTIYKKKMLAAKQEYENTKDPQLVKDIAKYNNIQMARKIQLNSAYGAIGNEYFRYFRLENAEAITLSGQLSIRWIENKMNEYLNKILKSGDKNYVIAVDTDSIYLDLGDLVKNVFKGGTPSDEKVVNFLDKICKVELETYIESCYQELATYVNAYQQKMVMKRENIANRGIWTAKKRYILNVWDSEGVRYKEPKMKIMGLETQRSSTPAYFRDKLLEAYKIMIKGTNDDMIDYISDIKRETQQQSYIDISFPRGCNGLEKYRSYSEIYKKGTPIAVRGALLYNHYLKQYKITNKFPLIQEGEKVKFIYLKTPNPIGENIISFFNTLPKEFKLEKYINHQMQFEKSFLEPLKSVIECIGWKHERTGSLSSFFS
jgi:DNA polymerase elongation subunit (family B)